MLPNDVALFAIFILSRTSLILMDRSTIQKVNQVVLWDKIIQRGEKAVVDLNNMNTKYYFFDDGNGLR